MIKEWKNKKHLLLLGIAAMFLAFGSFPATAEAQGKTEVYVSTTKSATDHSGDGTKTNPYNLFNDAVNNVANGGTIYILSNNYALMNDLNSKDDPLVINKNISIKSDSGTKKASLSSRAAGIILGGDVTFENINLTFQNPVYTQIFANGHHLTLKNVSRVSSGKEIDLVAGSLYISGTSAVGAAPGTHGQITVEDSSGFRDIYAGSINGSFDGNISITLRNVKGSYVRNIYACGADAYGSAAPVPCTGYPVNGKVSFTLDRSPVLNIDGTGSKSTEIIFNTLYSVSSCSYTNIDKMTITAGTFQPNKLTAPYNRGLSIELPSDGTLDLTNAGNLTVENFWGGGTLILGKDSLLTITKDVTGSTAFVTGRKSSDGSSQIVAENHIYIKTPPVSKGTFTFNPYFTQTHLKLQKQSNGDWKIVNPSITPEPPEPEQPEPEQPEPEQPGTPDPDPEKPDPDDTDSGNTSPGTPPPAAPKPSAPAVTAPKPVNVSLSKPKVTLKRGKKYAVIKYKKVKNAHGYEIYRSNKKKSGYKKVATTKKTSYKNKKLKSRKKYYYKVRAYRTVNGQKYYSSYSAVKSVKVK